MTSIPVTRPVARRTDPHTSHEAAASVEKITETQSTILRLLKDRAMTDTELWVRYYGLVAIGKAPRVSESGLRTRRSELVRRGAIEDSGERAVLASGRRSVIWQLPA